MSHGKMVLASIWVGLIVALIAGYSYLLTPSHAAPDDYWKGTIDEKIKAGEEKDKVLFLKMDAIDKKLTDFCDTVNTRVTNAEKEIIKRSGGYGLGASGLMWLILYIGKILVRKERKEK